MLCARIARQPFLGGAELHRSVSVKPCDTVSFRRDARLRLELALMPKSSKIELNDQLRAEAKRNPNGWVYAIHGSFDPNGEVPPEAIAGAWRVDPSGDIIEASYVANPRYRGEKYNRGL